MVVIIRLLLALFFIGACLPALAQCNTTLSKLLPEGAVNNEDHFGYAIAANSQYLVIGAEQSDTLGLVYGGAAYVYEKTAAGWAYRAMLMPSDPDVRGFFGTEVAIDDAGSTIAVLDRRLPHNRIYIFEKPAGRWETTTETVQLRSPAYSDTDLSLALSADGSEIAVNAPWSQEQPLFAIFRRPVEGWRDDIVPYVVFGPGPAAVSSIFAISLLFHDQYLYVTTDDSIVGSGILVYEKTPEGYHYVAKLSLSTDRNHTFRFGRQLTAIDDKVATTTSVSSPLTGLAALKVVVFTRMGEWEDATETAIFEIPSLNFDAFRSTHVQFLSPTEIAASSLVTDGEWYTGKVAIARTLDGTWGDVTGEVVDEEKNVHYNSPFGKRLVWNGVDLIRSGGSAEFGLASREAVVSISNGGSGWGKRQVVSLTRRNGSNSTFGLVVKKFGEALFSSAPHDGAAGRGAGAVYVYRKSGDEFVKINKIVPTRRTSRADGTTDLRFGFSLGVHGDELAIGAPSFLYAPELLGKVFLYKRSGPTWGDVTLYDSLSPPPELMLNRFGADIVMNERFLIASAYNNFDDVHTNAVVIFERMEEEWEYRETIELGKPLDKSWPSVKLSLSGNHLLVSSFRSLDGGVRIYRYSDVADQWESMAYFPADVFSTAGQSVKLLENHMFVGVPDYSYQGVKNAGAVIVFTKLPGQEWNSSMTPSAIIGADTPVEDGHFGTSLDVVGNTLAVGAPGSVLSGGTDRAVPGNTYIIQAKDYFWQRTTQLLNLQGERHAFDERDHFGAAVGVDEETFYVGASNENTEAGVFSGATYYVPSPPVVFLVPPVCANAGPVQLHSYPFGGSWMGSGVTSATGVFDPSLYGAGVYELTYTTENCLYTGQIEIGVIAQPELQRVSGESIALCEDQFVTLSVSQETGLSYSWFFKANGTDQYMRLVESEAQMKASLPGQYYAQAYNGACSSDAIAFTVFVEDIEVAIGPQSVVCNRDESVALKVSGTMGVWEGDNVKDNVFHAERLSNGKYPVTFRFTTPKGCHIALPDTVEVRVIPPVPLKRVDGDFCESGLATLQAVPSDPSLELTWFYGATETVSVIEKDIKDVASVVEAGYYHVIASDGVCLAYSDTVEVGFDHELSMTLNPGEGSAIDLCADDPYTIEAEAREGTHFRWYHRAQNETDFFVIAEGDSPAISVEQAGEFKVMAEYGFCYYTSEPVIINIKRDSVWAPNVITPNGDPDNEVFEVFTNTDDYELSIFDRHGKPVYSVKNGSWNGGDSPAGVYFWQVNYAGCKGRRTAMKGWLHLLR